MEHKGLIYTLSGIFVLALMMTIIAFGLNSDDGRNFAIDSYPSGATIYLNGEIIGKTPFVLDADFFKSHNIEVGEMRLVQLFTPMQGGIEINQFTNPKKSKLTAQKSQKTQKTPLILTFTLPTKAAIPERFESGAPNNAPKEDLKKIGAFIAFTAANKFIVAFNPQKLPKLDHEEKSRAAITLFSPQGDNVSLTSMGEYKSFKLITIPKVK